jgi:hypothetical protein
MLSNQKYVLFIFSYGLTVSLLLIGLCWKTNSVYHLNAHHRKVRSHLLDTVYLSSPAIVPAGRNIAFEIGNAAANAPASYLTMLDCCESDEAISDRIAVGQTQCRIIRKNRASIPKGVKTD